MLAVEHILPRQGGLPDRVARCTSDRVPEGHPRDGCVREFPTQKRCRAGIPSGYGGACVTTTCVGAAGAAMAAPLAGAEATLSPAAFVAVTT